jgi:outer membrane protein assembly factor BamA
MKTLLVAVVLCATLAFSQERDSTAAPPAPDTLRHVLSVTVTGNTRTKDFVILREMTLRPGAPISRELIEYDKNRIYSLGLFNRVEIYAMPKDSAGADLLVDVNERWYLFPYPIFGLKDRDWGKAFYGVGLLHNNFRGRNEKLFASFIFGFDPSVSLYYRNAFLDETGTYFLEGRLSVSRVRNRSVEAKRLLGDFDERHFNTSATVGRRFGISHTVWASLGYEVVNIPDNRLSQTLSPDGIDAYPVATAGYSLDTRDLREYPASGDYFRAGISKFGWPSKPLDLVRYAADVRHFAPLPFGTTLGVRVFTDLVAGGRTPTYNRVYFGYGERIRGHFKEVMEGENQFGAVAEFRVPLLTPRYFSVGFLPREFGLWRFGISAAVFADAGTVWFRGQPFALNDLAKGYGAGIHFLLPYSVVLRTEVAWNEARRSQFIIDVGTSL